MICMKEVTLENILKLIKDLRTSEGISQKVMAEKLGMSTSFYGMIERGNRSLTVEILIKIANAHDCSLTDLIETVEAQ